MIAKKLKMPPTSSMNQNRSNLSKELLKLSLVLALFVAPISVILNRLFGGGYIYFAALPDFVILTSFLVLILNKLKSGEMVHLVKNKLDCLVWIYLAISLIYVIWGLASPNLNLSLGQGFLSSTRFAFVYLSFRMSGIKFSDLFSEKIIKLSLFVILIFGLVQFFYPDVLSFLGYGSSPIKPISTVDGTSLVRAQSFLRGPNPYGAFLLIPFSFLIFNFKKIKDRLTSLSLILLVTLNLILTWSRSAWLGGILILVIWGFTNIKLSKKMLAGGLITSFLLVISSVAIFKTDAFKTAILHDKPGVGGSANSDQNRVQSYKNALSLIKNRPLGYGLDSAGPASVRSTSGVKIVENYFLQIFLQLGWLGGVLFILISCWAIVELFKLKSVDSMALGASGLALAVVGLMQPVWVDVSVTLLWWSFFGIALQKK